MDNLERFPYEYESENTKKYVINKIEEMLNSYLSEENKYKREKFINVFAEYLLFEERNLYWDRGIHRNQIQASNKLMELQTKQGRETYIQKIKEIDEIMRSETDRLTRLFSIILT